MAIKLSDKPNVTAPGGAYSYGDIKDNSGSNDGTPVNRLVYADFHQFFERLMALAGVTHNGLPENDTNTYQLMEALTTYINSLVPAVTDISGGITVDPAFTVGNLSAQEYLDGTIVITLVATYSGAISANALIMSGIPALAIPVVNIQACLLATAALATTAAANVIINNTNNTVKVMGGFSGSYTSLFLTLTYKKI